jgi:peptidoglycan/LPS O-acetylase OafA/YrhL
LGLFHTRCSLFINPVLCFIGKTSYSLYICHFAVLHLFGKIWPDGLIPGSWSSTPLAFILVLIVSCVAASITYALIELPGVSLGMSITRRIEHWHEQKRVAPRV